MEILRLVAERENERFEIVEVMDMINTTDDWFYVYRYVAGRNTHDFLQPGMNLAKKCAQSEWDVPMEAWRNALPGEESLLMSDQ